MVNSLRPSDLAAMLGFDLMVPPLDDEPVSVVPPEHQVGPTGGRDSRPRLQAVR